MGVGGTVLQWPTQTGRICLDRKKDRVARGSGPDPNPGLVSSSARTRHPSNQTLGWGLSDVSIVVVGGFQQNDTKAYCPGIVPCFEASCSRFTSHQSMSLRRINMTIVAPTGEDTPMAVLHATSVNSAASRCCTHPPCSLACPLNRVGCLVAVGLCALLLSARG